MRTRSIAPGLAFFALLSPAQAESLLDGQRGRLLYETACATCHTEQAHWRDKSLVHDWPGLLFQVTRWQENAGQQWRAQEIQDVAAYLNRRFYRLPCPVPGCAPDPKIGLGGGR